MPNAHYCLDRSKAFLHKFELSFSCESTDDRVDNSLERQGLVNLWVDDRLLVNFAKSPINLGGRDESHC